MGYGVAMFRLLLLISCLGFVIGYGGESVAKPRVAEPTVAESASVEPKVWQGDVTTLEDLNRVGSYTEITGNLIVNWNTTLTTIDMPQLQSVGGYIEIINNNNLTTRKLISNLCMNDDLKTEENNIIYNTSNKRRRRTNWSAPVSTKIVQADKQTLRMLSDIAQNSLAETIRDAIIAGIPHIKRQVKYIKNNAELNGKNGETT